MKIKNYQISDFFGCEILSKKLPIELSYILAVNAKALKPTLDVIEQKKQDLIHQYAKKDENGNIAVLDDGNIIVENGMDYLDELGKFMNCEVEVTVSTIDFSKIEKVDDTRFDSLSPSELMAIDFMVIR